MAASSAAEVVASFALCPLEVTKIYMMMNTDDAKNGLLHCMANIVHRDGPSGLFTGLPLIMLRQIPYTCVKLSGYEVFSRMMTNLLSMLKDVAPDAFVNITDRQMTTAKQLSGGVLAGVSAAIVSQPADVLLSKLCGSSSRVTLSSECLVMEGLPRFVFFSYYVLICIYIYIYI